MPTKERTQKDAHTKFIPMKNLLEALVKRIEAGMKRQARYYVSAPAEMARLGSLEHAEAFAREHGWMLVSHMNGEHYEFIEARPGQVLF